MSKAVFRALLAQNLVTRFQKTPGSRLAMTKAMKGKAWVYPLATELAYRRHIQKTIERFREPFLEGLDRALAPIFPKTRLDADEMGQWDALMNQLLDSQKETFNPNLQQNFIGGLFTFGQQASNANMREWDKFATVAIGTPFHPDEPWIRPTLEAWAEKNYTLIKSISDLYILKANEIVRNAVQEGVVYSEVRDRLRVMDRSMTKKKAQLIARDQIGKLNGELTGARQNEAGIEFYIWQTVGDERVRGNPSGRYPRAIPSHWSIDGKLCRWDDPTVYSEDKGKTWIPRTYLMPKAHPGQEILCRCAAIPYLDNLFTEEATNLGAVPIVDKEEGPTAEGALESLKNIMPGSDRLPLDRWIKLGAGPDIQELFRGVSADLWAKAPQKTLPFKQLTRTLPDIPREILIKELEGEFPDTVIKAVRYNGSTYLIDEESHRKIAALSLSGEYRTKMLVLDGDKWLNALAPSLAATIIALPLEDTALAPKPIKVKIPGESEFTI